MAAKTDHLERLDLAAEHRGLIISEHRGRYLWAAQLAEGLRVLDAGCGTGYGLKLIEEGGASGVVGVDIAEEAVARAAELNDSELVEVLQADVGALPFADDTFDLVVCFETLEHLDEQERAIRELRRVLRPAGLLAISSPNREVYPPGNPYHTHEFVPEELEQALASEFTNVRLYRQSPWLSAAILDDEQSRAADRQPIQAAHVVKLAAVQPGSEVFTVALASAGELPDPEALVVMGDPFEIRWWHEQLDIVIEERDRLLSEREQAIGEREQLLSTLRTQASEHEQERQERGRALLAAEARLASANSDIAQLQASRADLERWATEQAGEHQETLTRSEDFERRLRRAESTMDDITSSLSWRITAPVRWFKQLFRRLM